MTDEIRLVIPAEEEFRRIAHLVAGGLALRLDLTYDALDDLQVAIDELLALREDERDVAVVLAPGTREVRASLGPFGSERLRALTEEGAELGLRRVLETVCDTVEVEERDDGSWVELTKRIATATEAAG